MNQPGPPPGHRYRLTPVPSQHVPESRRLILAAAKTVEPRRAIVLGAGNCTEIPLAELAAQFQEILVNDLDEKLLEQGLAAARLDPAARARISLHVGDLTGATEPLLAKIDAALAGATSAEAAIDAMSQGVDEEDVPGAALPGRYEFVVASCVLSQLHFALLHRAGERFESRFPGLAEQLRASVRWTKALYDMARRMERRFVDDLAALVAPDGLVYLSESTQMCYVTLNARDEWETPGTYRMLRTQDLADNLDARFTAVARGRWHWVVAPPEKEGEVGRLFDVQALVLRMSPRT